VGVADEAQQVALGGGRVLRDPLPDIAVTVTREGAQRLGRSVLAGRDGRSNQRGGVRGELEQRLGGGLVVLCEGDSRIDVACHSMIPMAQILSCPRAAAPGSAPQAGRTPG